MKSNNLPSHNGAASPSSPELTFHTQVLGCKENKHAKSRFKSTLNKVWSNWGRADQSNHRTDCLVRGHSV